MMLSHYRAPTPVSFPVSHPSGVWMLVPREPTPPAPSESGLDDVYESFLAFAASCTINGRHIRFSTNDGVGILNALTSIVDLLYISF